MNILLWIAVACLTVRLGFFVALHMRYRSFNILRNTVSDYGTGETRKLYSMMSSLSAFAYVLVTISMMQSGGQNSWLVTVLAGAAIGSIAIMFFPTDKTGSKNRTTTGRIHWALAILNFALLFIFMVNISMPSGAYVGVATGATWIVKITFYAFIATLVLPKLRRKFVGLTERLFLMATPVWFIIFSLSLMH